MPTTAHLATVAELTLPRGLAAWASDDLVTEMLASWAVKNPKTRTNAAATLGHFAAWAAARGTDLVDATTADCRAWLTERGTVVAPATCVKNWSQLVAFYRACGTPLHRPAGWAPLADARRRPTLGAAVDRHPRRHRRRVRRPRRHHRPAQRPRPAQRRRRIVDVPLRATRLRGRPPRHRPRRPRRALGLAARHQERPAPPPPAARRDPRAAAPPTSTRAAAATPPGPLLVNIGGRRVSPWLTTTATQNVVKRAAVTAGVPVSPHSLRRGWCVAFMAGGGTESACMEIAGWTSNVMILRYLADHRAQVAQQTSTASTATAVPPPTAPSGRCAQSARCTVGNKQRTSDNLPGQIDPRPVSQDRPGV